MMETKQPMNKEQILTKIWEAITPYIKKPKQPVFEIVKDILNALPDPKNNTDKILAELANTLNHYDGSWTDSKAIVEDMSDFLNAQEINALSEGDVIEQKEKVISYLLRCISILKQED